MNLRYLLCTVAVGTCFACAGADNEDATDTSEQALGTPSFTCPSSLSLSTARGNLSIPAPIRASIQGGSMFCSASSAVSAFAFNVKTSANDLTGGIASTLGTLAISTEGASFVLRFKLLGVTVQTLRANCPALPFTTAGTGWNSNSGTFTATATLLSSSSSPNIAGTCSYSTPAGNVHVSLAKPADVFAAFGSSFYTKSALSDSELNGACSTTCNTSCTGNIPSGTRLDGVGECIQNCINQCVRR